MREVNRHKQFQRRLHALLPENIYTTVLELTAANRAARAARATLAWDPDATAAPVKAESVAVPRDAAEFVN